ncbi:MULTISPECIES: PH domain-containing protein [Halomicrobium]|uniref:Membrane-flanked domain protein n=2 Tax=Halomicrobium mukohataei TaxID=57705 RepID=C7NWL7_HALMD|nr:MULTISPECIES: PH domain-containing protein [Halomicrobium]ACV48227.1 membrane-flanked domain protein [Halomicrobium mukohataei DSM 12286]QCD66648.1 hypothetical protein E5139_13710 [Halomicrobium mukohataei]QFR21454.1 PH domain-containing protein [Halomicrobium sp. ZPS1]
MNRLHPISAVGSVVTGVVRLGSIGFFAGMMLTGPLDVLPLEAVFVLAPVGALVGAAYAVARYYRFTYALAGGTLSVDSGVFDRQEREIPLGRIQNVDIERGPVQRLFGLAVVKFETAGGSATEAVLNAVDVDEARALQSAVAQYRREGDETASDEDEPAHDTVAREPTGPGQRRIYELSTRDLLTLALVSFRPAAPAVVLFGVPFAQEYALRLLSATVETLGGPSTVSLSGLPTYSTGETLLTVGVAAALFALAAWLLSAAFTITEYYGFHLDYVGDDLRYERGLIQQYSGSIPLEKVQTVTVRENLLMRQVGYAALAVETAGYAPGSGSQDASNTAIPLDDRETVLAVAEALTDADVPAMERLPDRSRRRYAVRYSLLPVVATGLLLSVDTLVQTVPYWYAPLALLPVTALAGHLSWKHRGFALLDHLFATRSGVLVRSTRLVPYYRVQTVIDTRTVFQRRLSLASVTADTASTASLLGGDATAHDLDDQRARTVHETLRERLMADLRAGERGDRRQGLTALLDEADAPDGAVDAGTPDPTESSAREP